MPADTSTTDVGALVEDQGDVRRRRFDLRWPTGPEALAWAGDAVALVLLGGVLLWWEVHDGGRHRPELVGVGVLALAAAPVVVTEARRVGPRFALLLGTYGLGWLGALALAVDRHDWVDPLLTLGIVPAVGLAARRIWRRPWGPTVLVALLLLAFGRYTYRSWLQWWGNSMRAFQPLWMPLSWRNQSGTLMGGFGLLLLGIAWCARRVVAVGFALLAGAAFAGVWLSSSRGAIAFTGAAAIVMLVAAVRSLPSRGARRRVAGTSALALVAAAAVSVALLAMLPTGTTTPMGSRDQAAGHNAVARVNHVQAALRMFADRPVAGQGPGSYTVMALDFTDADANLTSSAHNEYVEVLATGGLLGGLPFLLLHVGVAILVWRRLRHGVALTDDPSVDIRGAMTLGAVGLVTLVGAHSAFDFDWDYAVLPSLLAFGAALLSVRPEELVHAPAVGPTPTDAPPTGRGHGWSRWAAAPVVLLVAVALVGHVLERRWGAPSEDLDAAEYAAYGAPWDAELRGEIVATLLRQGELELAREAADDAVAWNPGIDKLRRLQALVRYEQGELDAAGLVATLEEGRSRFTSYIDVADTLIADGEHELAAAVLDDVQAQLARHAAWGVDESVMDVGIRRIAVAGELHGCAGAEARAEELRQQPAMDRFSDAEEAVRRAVEVACA